MIHDCLASPPTPATKEDSAMTASGRLEPRSPITALNAESIFAVMTHPAQQGMVREIADLIGRLRQCQTPADYYDFQPHLFAHLYKVEERRGQCSRMIKRLNSGKRYQPRA